VQVSRRNSVAPVVLLTVLGLLVASPGAAAFGSDWPMWRYDAARTAASPDDLPAQLQLRWVQAFTAREPVWENPLNRDLMPYDRVFEPIILGGRVIIGCNDSDKVMALDCDTGRPLWTVYTDGPVRLPPVGWQEKIYFASDDGCLYCVQAADGKLLWRFRGGPSPRKVLGNKRVISMWPARGGPVLRDGHVYFAAGIWPFMGTFIYALDAVTGEVQWVNDSTGAQYIKQPHSAPAFGGVAPQGALVATAKQLLVPGGRSVPASFDRKTGKFHYFHLNAGGKGTGGSLVLADEDHFYVHTRRRGVRQFDLQSGVKTEVMCNEPVLAGPLRYTATEKAVEAIDRAKKVRWKLPVDGRGDLIKTGGQLIAAGRDAITAIALADGDGQPAVAWSLPVEGEVLRLLAGNGKLIAVTRDGRIMAFGAKVHGGEKVADRSAIIAFGSRSEPRRSGEATPIPKVDKALVPLPVPPATAERVCTVLDRHDARNGYALCFGIRDTALLAALVAESDLHIVAVDPDAATVAKLRRQLDAAGWYGRRVSVHVGDPVSFQAPPYIAQLVVADGSLLAGPAADDQLSAMYASLRPYGGTLWCPHRAPPAAAGKAVEQAATASHADGLLRRIRAIVARGKLPKAELVSQREGLFVVRPGPLPGAAEWTHMYGNVANTVKSNDRRVRAPLGILWFGGNSNEDVLPRHGHGPPPQVIGGRLFVQGIQSVSARDVYTGRVVWKRNFKDLGTLNDYYDATYKHTPLDPSYNQVHIPGANTRGTNYVATREGLYLVVGSECLRLDNTTGQTLKTFKLPTGGRRGKRNGTKARWAFLGVYEDVLLGGTGFANYTRRLPGVSFKPDGKRGPAWGPDHFGSLGLVAFERHSGAVLWRSEARYSYLNNGIVAGNGKVYCLDRLPKSVASQLARRGAAQPANYRIIALDAGSGETVWETDRNVFGTWLGFSADHDILLHAGAAAKDRSPEEVGKGLVALRGRDGKLLWKKQDATYAGPCILHGKTIIPNTTSYKRSVPAISLLDGSELMIEDSAIGGKRPWRYQRSYGCTTAIASEYLLTYRSGAAGYYDLIAKCGTASLGGFRSGCSSSLVAADGVLNAPEYTRTCSCGYQNQTSLALVHMPDVETWSLFPVADLPGGDWLERIGVNLGAPGDRRAKSGTLWLSPNVEGRDEGPSPIEGFDGEGLEFYCHHASAAHGDGPPWVIASGARNLRRLTLRLRNATQRDDQEKKVKVKVKVASHHVPSGTTGAGLVGRRSNPSRTSRRAGQSRAYTVRLYFAEPDPAAPGQRVFDVALQDTTVVAGMDLARQAGGQLRGVVRQFKGVLVDGTLEVTLMPRGRAELGPVLAGVECVAE
jgi:outer membrane protein assembly factor BamB